jgi:ligand-binding sensor domain-containing protein
VGWFCIFLRFRDINTILLISGMVFSISVFSQTNTLVVQSLNSDQGLSEPTNAFIYRCSRGFLWTSSLEGLNRFDGKNVNVYLPVIQLGDSTTIDPNIQSNLFEDTKGNLWFTVGEGIIKYDRTRDTLVYKPLIDPTNRQKIAALYAFHLDNESNLWVAGNNQLFLYNIETEKVGSLGDFSTVRAYPILDYKRKTVGVVSSTFGLGVQIFSYSQGKLLPPVTFFGKKDRYGLPPAQVFHLLVENDTSIWLPSSIGLIHFNPKTITFQKYDHFNQNPVQYLVDAALWKDNYIWVNTSRQGLYLFDKQQHKFIGQDTIIWVNNQMINLKTTNNLYVDEEHNLWCSLWGKGIYYTNLHSTKFTHQLPADTYTPPSPRNVNTITQDASGTVWCGVSGEGVFQFKQKNKGNTNILNPQFDTKIPVSGQIRSILCDRNGTIWLITPESIETYSKEEGVFQKIGGNFNNCEKLFK